jgi:hypothetical protein
MKKVFQYLIVILLTGFGLITLFLSTSIIFDLFGIRAKEGNFVLLVVWANFICSLLYLIAVMGFIDNKKWTTILLAISTIILIAAFIGLKIHIQSGGLYEIKTINALIFRISATILFTILAYFTINKNKI